MLEVLLVKATKPKGFGMKISGDGKGMLEGHVKGMSVYDCFCFISYNFVKIIDVMNSHASHQS